MPSKKEISQMKGRIRTEVARLKSKISEELKVYKKVTQALRLALKDYAAANRALERKNNSKNSKNYDLTKEAMQKADALYQASYNRINGALNRIDALMLKFKEYATEKEFNKENKQVVQYKENLEASMGKMSRGLPEFAPAPVAELPEPEKTAETEPVAELAPEVKEEEPAPEVMKAQNPSATVASVNVAPVTIDVTGIVEKAIAATMEKLSRGLDKKIADYISALNIPAPSVTAAPVNLGGGVPSDTLRAVSSGNAELEKTVLEEEKYIYDKLTAMCASLKTTLDSLTELSKAYVEIGTRQQQIAELQKQTNDMQRHTMREQQGVQVNQRMVNKEQVEIVTEQSLVNDNSKALLDKQKGLADTQRNLIQNQNAVIDTQSALDEAMKAVMQAQKDIIGVQQQIIQGNAKNTEGAKALLEKQEELTAQQKEAQTQQKQLVREQKTLADRQRELAESIKEASSATPKKRATSTARKTAPKSDTTKGDTAEVNSENTAENSAAPADNT